MLCAREDLIKIYVLYDMLYALLTIELFLVTIYLLIWISLYLGVSIHIIDIKS